MPSSKRARVIPTSKTSKNRKDLVRRLHANIQECALNYTHIFVFDVQNMRNNFIKNVRAEFSDSRVVMGKTKVMMVALGRDAENEVVPGVSKLQEHVTGEVGLLFTNRDVKEVKDFFEGYSESDFARSGTESVMEVRIPPGEIFTQYGVGGEEDPLPVQIEPQLRKLGVPTRIKGGKVVLEEVAEVAMVDDGEEGYLICKEGDVLDSRQTSLLKILGARMSEFKMGLRAVYDKKTGEVQELGRLEGNGVKS